jgi:predicted Zn-dependent protease with MMP-like domain
MNERIKELEVQCWDDVAPEWAENVHMVFNIEKFAELIVRECMEQVWYTREDGINGNVSQVIKDRIKQHFGVEE